MPEIIKSVRESINSKDINRINNTLNGCINLYNSMVASGDKLNKILIMRSLINELETSI